MGWRGVLEGYRVGRRGYPRVHSAPQVPHDSFAQKQADVTGQIGAEDVAAACRLLKCGRCVRHVQPARPRALRRAARPPVAFASLQNCMLQRRCEQLVYKNRECPHCSQLYCVGCINYDEPCLSCGNRFDESRHNKCVPGYACEYACEYPSE